MPATYAHWAFGNDCINKMPNNLKEIIIANREIFDLGVHGPDILFYDLAHPKIPKHGSAMHNIPAEDFFRKAKEAFLKHKEKEQMLAYIMGFLSHFVLDSTCHGYVERKRELSICSHNKIESEWEQHIMLLDKRKPNLVDRTESLKPNKENSKIISYFFPYSQKEILRSCKMQRTIVKQLNCFTIKKQNRWQKFLRKNKLNNYADLFIGFEEDENCKDSNIRLDKLRTLALKRFPRLMKNLIDYLNGTDELVKYFNHDFGPWDDYKKIEVLPYNEELKYKVK